MKEKISVILKSKSFYIAFSVLLAIGAWLMVISSQNPKESRSIEVPITFVNRNVLVENDLVDNSATTMPTTVTVKVSGSEVFIDQLQPSDLYVEVDYKQVTGPGNITLKIKEPECETLGVSVDSYYPMEIECVYDKTVERYIEVQVDWDESVTADGISIISAEAEPSNVLVTGYSMVVEQISAVRVNLADLGSKITKSGTTSLPCRFYNEAGEDISYNFASEKVTVKYTTGKIVPVKYSIAGTPAANYYVASHLPSVTSVTLTGDSDAINKISAINLGNISVQGKNDSFTSSVKISDYLPEDVTVVDVTQIDVKVNISKYSSKTFAVTADKLKIAGEKQEYTYSYTMNSNTISLTGTETDLNKVTDSSVNCLLDVSALAEGTHTVKISVTLPDGVSLQGEYNCTVVVSKKNTTVPDSTAATNEPEATPNSEPAPVSVVEVG